MKKFLAVIVVMFFGTYLFGCGKKQAATEQPQEPMSMEVINTTSTTPQVAPETKPVVTQNIPAVAAPVVAKLESLPPAGPYKPTGLEIQTALKNAGFYTGKVDGRIGHMTKKAIEEFQKANGLTPDAKVGPKTWALLSQHLNPVPSMPTPSKKR